MNGKINFVYVKRVIKGVMIAAVITIAAMLLLTGWVVLRGMDDKAIRLVNQGIKVLSILAGVFLSVRRGGEKGLITGALVGMLYILIGYGLYSAIDGTHADAKVMAVEEMAGALVGASAGVVLANMKAKNRARR